MGAPPPKIAPLGGLPSGPYPKTGFVKIGQNRGTEGRPRFSGIFRQLFWVIRGSKKALEPVASRHYVYIKASQNCGASYTPPGVQNAPNLCHLWSQSSSSSPLLCESCLFWRTPARERARSSFGWLTSCGGWPRSSPLVSYPQQCFLASESVTELVALLLLLDSEDASPEAS